MPKFNGKIALVTGAAQGLGKAIAASFLENGAEGVALLDLNPEALTAAVQELDHAGRRTLTVVCNVSNPVSVQQAFTIVRERFGRVDILVNNAGITRDSMFHKMSDEQFDLVLKVSLYGTYYCTRQVVDGMRERGYGRIVNMSSMANRGNIGQANYAAAKAGIIGMTKTLAMELGSRGITANCVAPSMINTDILKTMPEKVKQSMTQAVPLRRIGEPREVADVVAFLASEEASYISGQCINISGGLW